MKAVEGRGSRGEGESERRGADAALHVRLGGVRGLRGERQKRRKKKIKICYFAFFVAFLWFCIVNSEEKKKRGMVEKEDKMHQSETEKNEFV